MMLPPAAPFKPHGAALRKIGWILSAIALSVLTLVIARQFLVYLPADHFSTHAKRNMSGARRWAQRIGGVLLVALGVVLALPGVPGQGLLMILIGLILVDVPVLRRLELRLLRVAAVSKAVNAMRVKAGQPPLELPADPPG